MSKAEDRALEKYPFMPDDDKEGLEALKYIGMECECASVFNEVQEAKHIYLGAIKINPMTKEYYQEVLKRFLKERKENGAK